MIDIIAQVIAWSLGALVLYGVLLLSWYLRAFIFAGVIITFILNHPELF